MERIAREAHIAPNQLVAMLGEINSDHGLPLRNGRCSSQQANGIERPVSMQSNADVAGLASAIDPRYPLAWADVALCGAAELYRATGEQQYLTDALAYDEMVGSHQWAPNFSQSADFCRHSLIVGLRDEGNLAAAQPVAFKLDTDIDNYGFGNNPPSQPHHRNQIATRGTRSRRARGWPDERLCWAAPGRLSGQRRRLPRQ